MRRRGGAPPRPPTWRSAAAPACGESAVRAEEARPPRRRCSRRRQQGANRAGTTKMAAQGNKRRGRGGLKGSEPKPAGNERGGKEGVRRANRSQPVKRAGRHKLVKSRRAGRVVAHVLNGGRGRGWVGRRRGSATAAVRGRMKKQRQTWTGGAPRAGAGATVRGDNPPKSPTLR